MDTRAMRCLPNAEGCKAEGEPMVIPLATPDNAADAALGDNPKGRGGSAHMTALRPPDVEDHAASVAPCPAGRLTPSHAWLSMK